MQRDWPRPQGMYPECRCGQVAKVLQSHTPANPNRWFFKCQTCDYFTWADVLPGYPHLGGAGGQASTPQQQQQDGQWRQQWQTPGQQQQQPVASPGSVSLPRYAEGGTPGAAAAAAAAAAAGNFNSPGRPAPGAGYVQGGAGTPQQQQQQQGGWQQQPPMQQQPWGQQQQQSPIQPRPQGPQYKQQQSPMQQQQQPAWQQQSPVNQGAPPHQQHQQYPDANQPFNTFGNLQQPGGPPAASQLPHHHQQQQQHWGSHPGGSQGSQGAAAAAAPGSQQQQEQPYGSQHGYGSQQQQQQQPQQQQGPGQQQQWQQQQQQPFGSPGGPGFAQQQFGGQQQQYHGPQQQPFGSPMRPTFVAQQGVSPAPAAAGFGTPGSAQRPPQQQQYMSTQQQQHQQQPYMSPQQQQPFMSPQQQQYMSPQQQQYMSPQQGSQQQQQQQCSQQSPGAGQVIRLVPAPPSMPQHLGLKPASFSKAFVEIIKQLPFSTTERQWKGDAKLWLVLASAWQQVKAHLEAAGFTLQQGQEGQQGAQGGTGAAGAAVDLLASESSEARVVPLMSQDEAEETLLAANLEPQWGLLLGHQREGVLAGLRRGGRLLLADEMGLGKTAQAVLLACCYPDDWPLLVVVPAGLRGVWAAELGAWLPPGNQPQPGHIQIAKSGDDLRRMVDAGLPATRKQVLVLTYDLAKQLPANIAARFGVVICDESHFLKSRDTQRTKCVRGLVVGARRAMLLTGTPLLSRPIEAWSQVDMLRPNMLLGSFDDYGRKYCTPEGEQAASPAAASGRGSGAGRYIPVQPYQGCNKARADELHKLLLANVMVRRTKAQVGMDLPSKTRLKVATALDPACQPRLGSIWAAMQRLSDAGQADSAEGKRLLNEYRQATGEAKVQGVVEFVLELPGLKAAAVGDEQQQHGNGGPGSSAAAAAGASSSTSDSSNVGKLVVFAYHQQVLNALQAQLCEAQGLGFIRIDGKTLPQQRQQLVDRFQTDPSVQLALLSIKAAGSGLTLTAADRVVFAELHWNPSDLAQCEDRIHRVGQGRHCRVYYCLAAESADALMWGTVVRKLGVVGATVDGAQPRGSGQGLACLESWQRHLSQPEQDEEEAAHEAGGAAAADEAAPAGRYSSQRQSQGDGSLQLVGTAGGSVAALPAVLAAPAGAPHGTPRSRRRLLERFMEADEAPAAAEAATVSAAAAAAAAAAGVLLAEQPGSAAAPAGVATLPGFEPGSVPGSLAGDEHRPAAPAKSTESLIEEAEAAAAAATAAAAAAAAAAAVAAAAAAAVSAARGSVHSNAGSRSVSGEQALVLAAAASGTSQPGSVVRPAGSCGAGGSGDQTHSGTSAAAAAGGALAVQQHSQAGDGLQRLPTQGSQSTAQAGACLALSQQAGAVAAGRQHAEEEDVHAAAAAAAAGEGGSQGSDGHPAKRQRQQ